MKAETLPSRLVMRTLLLAQPQCGDHSVIQRTLGRPFLSDKLSLANPELHDHVIVTSHYIGYQLKAALLVEPNGSCVVAMNH